MTRSSGLIVLALALGLFLGGLSHSVVELGQLKPLSSNHQPAFRVVYISAGEPQIGQVGSLPEEVTFYLSPSKVDKYAQALSQNGREVRINSKKHSNKRKEQDIYLELAENGLVHRYHYRCGEYNLTPLAYGFVDSKSLTKAMGEAVVWALWALPLALLLFWADSRKRRD